MLLKPGSPARNVDSSFSAAADAAVDNDLGAEHLWAAPLSLEGSFVVFAANVSASRVLPMSDLQAMQRSKLPDRFCTREYYSGNVMPLSSQDPFEFPEMPSPDSCASRHYTNDYCIGFSLWTFVPAHSMGIVFLGEMDKFIAISPQRFTKWSTYSDSSFHSVTVHGSPNELVQIGISTGACASVRVTQCKIGDEGAASFRCLKQSNCSCSASTSPTGSPVP